MNWGVRGKKRLWLSRHLPGETKDNHAKSQAGWPVSVQSFELGDPPVLCAQKRYRSAVHSITTFGAFQLYTAILLLAISVPVIASRYFIQLLQVCLVSSWTVHEGQKL